MDSSKAPDLIADTYYALGVNVSARGGRPRTRPALKQRPLTSNDGALEIIRSRPFLGASPYYDTDLAKTFLVACFGGKLVIVDPVTYDVSQLTPADEFDFYTTCWFCQADHFLIVQNGTDVPFIFDGATARRSHTGTNNPSLEVATLTQAGGVGTLTTTDPHGFVTGDYIRIEGAAPEAYNIDTYIIVTAPTTFTFLMNSTADSPAAGTITCRYTPEVPVGTVMEYGQGRLFVAAPERTTFLAGDIIFGDLFGAADNLLRFAEDIYLAEGGSFSLPQQMGRIVAMKMTPFLDSATGQGELFVLGEYGVASYGVSIPREEWKNNPIQRITFTNTGGVSPNAITSVNNDLVFRAPVGLQTYRQARRELGEYGQASISAELARIFDTDDQTLLRDASMELHNNRLMLTCGPTAEELNVPIASMSATFTTLTVTTEWPHRLDPGDTVTIHESGSAEGDYTIATTPTPTTFTAARTGDVFDEPLSIAHLTGAPTFQRVLYRGVASLDFAALTNVGAKLSPAYDGVWTGFRGLQILQGMFAGAPRLFLFAAGDRLGTALWEFTEDPKHDELDGATTPQQCVLETRGFDFTKPFTLKKLMRADLWLSDIRGAINFKVFFRSDNRVCWTPWHEFDYCAEVDEPQPTENDQEPFSAARPQVRLQRRLPSPPDFCEPSEGVFTRQGYVFQIRLEWRGVCRVDKFMLHALELGEQMGGDC